MKSSFNIDAKMFFGQKDIRMDVNYWITQHLQYKESVPFDNIFEVVDGETINIDNLPDEFDYCQIGDLNNKGELNPLRMYLSQIGNEDNDDYKVYKKVFGKDSQGNDKTEDIMAVNNNEILIAKTRPLLNKVILIHSNEYDDNSNYYYTKAFIRLKIKDEKISPVLAYFVIKFMLNNELVSISRIGKSGYPAIDKNDLSLIRIPIKYEKLIDEKLNNDINNKYIEKLKITYELNKQKNVINEDIRNKIVSLQKLL